MVSWRCAIAHRVCAAPLIAKPAWRRASLSRKSTSWNGWMPLLRAGCRRASFRVGLGQVIQLPKAHNATNVQNGAFRCTTIGAAFGFQRHLKYLLIFHGADQSRGYGDGAIRINQT